MHVHFKLLACECDDLENLHIILNIVDLYVLTQKCYLHFHLKTKQFSKLSVFKLCKVIV